jgi:hydrogenase maturation protein HypF
LKNTFCHARERFAFLSHHIGDLENYETLQSFEDGVAHFERLFRIQPEAIVYDLHPNYLATRYALERAGREGLQTIGVQHHHAHIAACMAENGLRCERPVIGVAFDGTGFGDDGAIWGGEFLVADYKGYQRAAHLAYQPLPGGDAATRNPWRVALAYLWQAGIDWEGGLPPVEAACVEDRQALRSMLEHHINIPPTSSMGRLFDAAAALAGVRQKVNYEAQAAIEFEALADRAEIGAYPFEIQSQSVERQESNVTQYVLRNTFLIHPTATLAALLHDWRAGETPGAISARFHNGVAEMVQRVCITLREMTGVEEIALSGGVWQNMTLLRKTVPLLENSGFTVYTHHLVPANDGGLALGQAAIGAAVWKFEEQ